MLFRFVGLSAGQLIQTLDNKMNTKLFNQIGLALCITGTSIIFFWGPPQPTFQTGTFLQVSDNTPSSNGKTAKENDIDIIRNKKLHSLMSKIGMILIVIGFIFQAIATEPILIKCITRKRQ